MAGMTSRACFECGKVVGEIDGVLSCGKHVAEAGWYVREDGGKIIGLGHEHFDGYLTDNGKRDLSGFRLAATMPMPMRVVDLRGRQLVLRALLKTRNGETRVLAQHEGVEVRLNPSTPVRRVGRRRRVRTRKLRTLASFVRLRRAS